MAFPDGKRILGIDHRIVAALLSADVPIVAFPLLGLFAATLSISSETFSPGTRKKIKFGAIVVVVFNIEYAGRMAKIISSGAATD